MKKTLSILLAVMIAVTIPLAPAFAATTEKATADTVNYGRLEWSYQAGSGYENAVTPPTVHGAYVYVGTGNRVLKLDKDSGSLLGSVELEDSFGFATASLTYVADVDGKNLILAPIGEGRVQAVDADTMESLWVTQTYTGQSSLARVVSQDGYLYFGTWKTETSPGYFFCYDVTDEDPASETEVKQCTWSVSKTGGFYWAEAYVSGDYVVFGSENGIADGTSAGAEIYSALTGGAFELAGKTSADSPVVDTQAVTGDIRSGVAYDDTTNRFYMTSKAGKLYKVALGLDGSFVEGSLKSLSLGGTATGTPTVYDGKVYVSVQGPSPYSQEGHMVKAIDGASMTVDSSVSTPGFVQAEMLLSTAQAAQGTFQLYMTCNQLPGGMYAAEINMESGKAIFAKDAVTRFFTPDESMQGYGISTIAVDENGVLLYKNDSGYLMAVTPGYLIDLDGATEDGQDLNIGQEFQDAASGESDLPAIAVVTVANNTYAGGSWTGMLFAVAVEITPGMTLGDAVKKACDLKGFSVTGATASEGYYITEVNGLVAGDGGGWSGFMCTVNNWMNTTGLSAPVENMDLISVQYSMDFGSDIGSIFWPVEDANNKKLSQVSTDGVISPAFDPDVHAYTLTVPYDATEVLLMPLAFNLNYQVRTTVEGELYKLLQAIPVSQGEVITVTVGDPAWDTMNNGAYGTGAENVPGEVYTFTVDLGPEPEVLPGGGTDESPGQEESVQEESAPDTGDAGFMAGLLPLALLALAGAGLAVTVRRRAQ